MALNAAFFNAVRGSLYAGALNQVQVDSFTAIGQAWDKYGDGDTSKLAYILATAHHETGAFKWLHEIWGPTAAQLRYEGRSDLGNAEPGDGKRFMGRGFVQLTGRRNYTDWSRRTGLDLVGKPDLVTQPDVAARILVQGSMLGTFTGKKLGDYLTFSQMRRVINGTDKAALIAGYAEKFAEALKGGVSAAPAPKPVPRPTAPPAAAPKSPIAIFVAALIGLVAAAYAFLKSNGVLP